MKRNIILAAALCSLLAGCATAGTSLFSSGENLAVGFWNNSDREIEQIKIHRTSAEGRRVKWTGQLGMKPRPDGRKTPGFGGDMYDNIDYKIPEEAEVSWREMPPEGAAPYTGELKGPYRVKVLSRIPPEIQRVARKGGYWVEITFSVGEFPILFDWMLVDRTGLTVDYRGKSKMLCQGGDSFQDPAKWEEIRARFRLEFVPLWPHCKLP